MVSIDYLIFGYRRISFREEELSRVLNIFLKNGLTASPEKDSVLVAERRLKRVEELLREKIEYTVSPPLGLWGLIYSMRKRYALIISVVLSLFLTIFFGDLVWDVRIEGSDGNEREIIEELENVGFSVGSLWSKTDRSETEARMLDISKHVSWININRRGTVAYVKVIDKTSHEEPPSVNGYANIVASRDAVIEEITVKSGIPLVKAGETVKEGQILISGVIPQELGGGFCYAAGTVRARYGEEISVNIPSFERKKVFEAKKLSALSVKIFGKEINIFKIYRNSHDNCDIMVDERELRFLGRTKLPISTKRKYVLCYTEKEIPRTESEMILMAKEKNNEAIDSLLHGCELLRMRTHGEFTDEGYLMHTDLIVSSDIARTLEFEIAP